MKLCMSGRLLPLMAASLFLPLAVGQNLVRDVRSAIGKNDFTAAEARIGKYRASSGVTSEMLEAQSWLGRARWPRNNWTGRKLTPRRPTSWRSRLLKTRRLDDDASLPIALGAAIEVQAQVMRRPGRKKRGHRIPPARASAPTSDTSIRTRIQKNINLLSLEGQPAPDLEIREWLGPKPAASAGLKGRAVLLFFWAHWCGDCKCASSRSWPA